MAFSAEFLDIFLAAPHLEYLDFGTLVGHLMPQLTEVTIADVIRITLGLSQLEVLCVPWMETVYCDRDSKSAFCRNPGTGEALNYAKASPAIPKLHELGFPCFYSDRDLCNDYLTLLASVFPALEVLSIFSAYFNKWKTSPLILNFSIECSDVVGYL